MYLESHIPLGGIPLNPPRDDSQSHPGSLHGLLFTTRVDCHRCRPRYPLVSCDDGGGLEQEPHARRGQGEYTAIDIHPSHTLRRSFETCL